MVLTTRMFLMCGVFSSRFSMLNWPCWAERILPNLLFESSANFCAVARAFLVASSIISGLILLKLVYS